MVLRGRLLLRARSLLGRGRRPVVLPGDLQTQQRRGTGGRALVGAVVREGGQHPLRARPATPPAPARPRSRCTCPAPAHTPPPSPRAARRPAGSPTAGSACP